MKKPKRLKLKCHDPEPDQYPCPSGEEMVAGALAELMDRHGVNPLDRASSDPDSPKPAIPIWFQKACDHL